VKQNNNNNNNNNKTGQSNLTKGRIVAAQKPVQLYSTVGANVHRHLIKLHWAHLNPHPKRRLHRFSRFVQLTTESPYTLQWAAPSCLVIPHSSLKIAPSHGKTWTQLIHGSVGQPEFTTQTASRSVQLFLHGSLSYRQTDRPTDRQTDGATRSNNNTN